MAARQLPVTEAWNTPGDPLDPRPGEVWTYMGDRFTIKAVDKDEGYVTLDKLPDLRYPLKYFESNSAWTLISPRRKPPAEELCPNCDEHRPLPNDYLCHKCRYGV